MPLDRDGLAHLLRWEQQGLVARRQLVDLGAEPHDVRRLLRRELHPTWLPGIYVDHSGALTWTQRAWAATLHLAPAALCGRSALPHPPQGAPIEVAVGLGRRTPRIAGVGVRRMADLDRRLHPVSTPPRIRIEHAALDVASAAPDTAARFRVLADACQSRRTTALAIADALSSRPRLQHRGELRDLLRDLATGACSVLERDYLLLERRHGLPSSVRQQRDRPIDRTFYRDVTYVGLGLHVELDGRPFHDTAAARDRDHERDLDTLVASGWVTVRLTYGQVCVRGCATIRKVATLLERQGWAGALRTCPDCPA